MRTNLSGTSDSLYRARTLPSSHLSIEGVGGSPRISRPPCLRKHRPDDPDRRPDSPVSGSAASLPPGDRDPRGTRPRPVHVLASQRPWPIREVSVAREACAGRGPGGGERHTRGGAGVPSSGPAFGNSSRWIHVGDDSPGEGKIEKIQMGLGDIPFF